ncbi:hypothetical protein Aduo_010162 [Ancylostoma duodenale]
MAPKTRASKKQEASLASQDSSIGHWLMLVLFSSEERKREYELRQAARERNKGKAQREWVVYRSELVRASDLNRHKSGNM